MNSVQHKKEISYQWRVDPINIQKYGFVQSHEFGTESTIFFLRCQNDNKTVFLYLASSTEEKIFVDFTLKFKTPNTFSTEWNSYSNSKGGMTIDSFTFPFFALFFFISNLFVIICIPFRCFA